MKLNLPLIGTVRTGKDAIDHTQSEKGISTNAADFKDGQATKGVLGGLIEFALGSKLSNEKTISTKLLQANKEWVFRNNDVIAHEVSNVEFKLYRTGLKDGEITYTVVDDHPLLELLDSFNATTTKSDGIYVTQSHKKLAGDAFWLLERGSDGLPANIYLLPPDKVELALGDPTQRGGELVEAYNYVDTIDNVRIDKTYKREDIIHFKKPNPNNPFRGYGVVEAAADTIDTDNLTNLMQRNFFEKGAVSNFVLTTDANLTQEQVKRLRAEMNAQHGGAKNAYKTMIFGNGLKPSNITLSNRDMQYLDLLEWYRDKIMVLFGNTKASLGLIDDVNRASYESASISWLRSSVKPDMDAIVGTLNEFLVPEFGDDLILGFNNPVPEDRTDDIVEAKELRQAGIISVNEAREMLGYDTVEGGDELGGAASNPATGDEDDSDNNNDEQEDEKRMKLSRRIYRKRTSRKQKLVPDGLNHFNIQKFLRRRRMYSRLMANQEFKEAAKPAIRKMLAQRRHKLTGASKTDTSTNLRFSDSQVARYYEKQLAIVDVLEQRFHDSVLAIIQTVARQALDNLEEEVSTLKSLKRYLKQKQLFDQEALEVRAELDLAPLLIQQAGMAGAEALKLLEVDSVYVPFAIEATVRQNVRKFATSMLETDRDQLTKLITDGIELGMSMPEIRDAIQSHFADYSKVQAQRITRTEVLRAANLGAQDAFEQSGIVEAKQWLIAPGADEACLPYADKIVPLKGSFYDPEGEFQDGNPPVHPNCFDDKTEVLSSEGWKLFKDVRGDETILSVDLENGNSEWVGIKENVAYEFDGQLVKYSNISTDLLVTPDHNQIVKFRPKAKGRKDAGKWQIVPENQLPNHDFSFLATIPGYVGMRPDTIAVGARELDVADYVKLMAMYLSDGSTSYYKSETSGQWQLAITCAKDSPTRHEVETIMDKLFPTVWKGEEKVTALVKDESVSTYFKQLVHSQVKYIPNELKALDKEYLVEFLDVYSRFDGTTKKGKHWKGYQFNDSVAYFTGSDKLATDIGELVLKVGGRPAYRQSEEREVVHHNGTYTSKPVWIIAHNTRTQPNRGGLKKELIDYRGYVYDVELEKYHTLFVRRNGKVMLSGNCRCILLPVVTGTRGYQSSHKEQQLALLARVKELESQIDKRTRAFKELKAKDMDNEFYIKALEKHLGVGDDQ